MKIIAKYIATIVLLAPVTIVFADTQNEIQHLLQFVENSGCAFERNGTVYDSKEAKSHIEGKYNYVKSYVDDAEDFIKYAAAESSVSGKKYHVTCNGNRHASGEWLRDELASYRAKIADSAALK